MSTITVVKADGWEGLFVSGKCIEQGHILNQGQERVLYFLDRSLEYNCLIEDIKFKRCTEDYCYSYLEDNGCFPSDLDEVELEG